MFLEVICLIILCSTVYAAINLILVLINYTKMKKLFETSTNITICPLGPLTPILQLFGRYNWLTFDQMHITYGKTWVQFFLDKPVISTTDLDLIKQVVLDDPYGNINRFEIGIGYEELQDSLIYACGEDWKRIRKVFAPPFRSHRVNSPNVQKEINQIINKTVESIEIRLKEASLKSNKRYIEEEIEMLSYRYSLDLTLTCMFKKENLIDHLSEKNVWVELAEASARTFINLIVILGAMFPFARPLTKWILGNFYPGGTLLKEIKKFVVDQVKLYFLAKKELKLAQNDNKIIDEDDFHLKDGTHYRRSICDYIIENSERDNLSKHEYLCSSVFLFEASYETSADAVNKLIYHMAKHQRVQDKLRESILKEGVDSKYLTWCILESLRLFPPVLFGSTRRLGRDIETKMGTIPKDTLIITPIYSISRLREYWGDDANDYNPERWSQQDSFHPCQFLSFGIGPRQCLGKAFALAELKMLLDNLLRKFKFERTSRTPDIMMFRSQLFIFNVADLPTYVKISYLDQNS